MIRYRLTAAALAAALAGCAPAAQTVSTAPGTPGGTTAGGTSAADAAPVAAEAQRATTPTSPRQAQFGWQLDEAGAQFRGRGVARYEAPGRFRLDLFGPRGETYLAAALVDGQMRVPAVLAQRFALPSPALLWGAVGIVAPPADARLLNSSVSGESTTIRYQLGTSVLEYRLRAGRLQSVRRSAGGGVAESIDLTWNDAGQLGRAQYRDWAAYRTLNLTVESQTDVAGFPEETWSPPGT
ncbi:hypothetical protein [Longimicrobium terrae]|uniref:Lipoprotein n=1 Tax=Longimicrobium terrae TaxID=1639882 RepID=A0A841GZZ8_9BACT|nr:hypothetical protein [Longimicrobium terrae]MBB4637065.1 hypothetical protein [Longimicrobium terrae]MBB6071327.1 hypothetical protein [Longimicrobium terrae]NNC31454.1 hypothetical protein [Longimicrobium terrae]